MIASCSPKALRGRNKLHLYAEHGSTATSTATKIVNNHVINKEDNKLRIR